MQEVIYSRDPVRLGAGGDRTSSNPIRSLPYALLQTVGSDSLWQILSKYEVGQADMRYEILLHNLRDRIL